MRFDADADMVFTICRILIDVLKLCVAYASYKLHRDMK